jgi:transcriptional regulator with XRE-family HTH domain
MNGKKYTTPQLRRIRLERDLTQQDFATKCGLSYPVISRAENGKLIQQKTLKLIAKGLNVPASELTRPDDMSA